VKGGLCAFGFGSTKEPNPAQTALLVVQGKKSVLLVDAPDRKLNLKSFGETSTLLPAYV
jgi:hypothetical protein